MNLPFHRAKLRRHQAGGIRRSPARAVHPACRSGRLSAIAASDTESIRAKPGIKPAVLLSGARPNLSYHRIELNEAIDWLDMSAKELKALRDKDIQTGDWVWLPYRGGKHEGHVQKIAMSALETPHPPKVALPLKHAIPGGGPDAHCIRLRHTLTAVQAVAAGDLRGSVTRRSRTTPAPSTL